MLLASFRPFVFSVCWVFDVQKPDKNPGVLEHPVKMTHSIYRLGWGGGGGVGEDSHLKGVGMFVGNFKLIS